MVSESERYAGLAKRMNEMTKTQIARYKENYIYNKILEFACETGREPSVSTLNKWSKEADSKLTELTRSMIVSKLTDWSAERVVTNKEKTYAQETERIMIRAGYSGIYAGGARSKGNGFWITKNGQSLGYMNCRSIRKMIKNS
jgi:hypothetical protein